MHEVLAVCLNPTFQRTFVVPRLWENEVNRSSEYYYDVAGKGLNTARILTQLGISAIHLTHVGGAYAKDYLDMNARDHIPIASIDTKTTVRTCYSIINSEAHTTTEIVEEAQRVAEDAQQKVMAKFRELLPEITILTIAGSLSPGYTDDIYPQMVKEAKAAGKCVVLDIRGKTLLDCMRYRPDYINPNFTEFASTFLPGLTVKEHEDDEQIASQIKEKMLELYHEYGSTCVLTHGALPTLFVEHEEIRQSPVKRIVPLNTIGSGDAFTSGLISIILKGGTVGEAVHKGQECGALNALKIRPGTIL